jgi:hypothetical protein
MIAGRRAVDLAYERSRLNERAMILAASNKETQSAQIGSPDLPTTMLTAISTPSL